MSVNHRYSSAGAGHHDMQTCCHVYNALTSVSRDVSPHSVRVYSALTATSRHVLPRSSVVARRALANRYRHHNSTKWLRKYTALLMAVVIIAICNVVESSNTSIDEYNHNTDNIASSIIINNDTVATLSSASSPQQQQEEEERYDKDNDLLSVMAFAPTSSSNGSIENSFSSSINSDDDKRAYSNKVVDGNKITHDDGDAFDASRIVTDDPNDEIPVATATVPLGLGVTMNFSPLAGNSKKIKIEATLEGGDAWLGIGIAFGDKASMNGDTTGTMRGNDVFACTNGRVKRYFIRDHQTPTGVEVSDEQATCVQHETHTKLTFTRELYRPMFQNMPILPGEAQFVNYAHGDVGDRVMTFHARRWGGRVVDFGTGNYTDSALRKGEPEIYFHIASMTLAWGVLLPLSIVVANRLRERPQWKKFHRSVNVAAIIIILMGYAMAIYYVEKYSTHMMSSHAIIGTVLIGIVLLQPIFALLKPSVSQDLVKDETSRAKVWGYIHRVVGYLGLLTAFVNMTLGITKIVQMDYELEVFIIPASIWGTGFIIAAIVFALSFKPIWLDHIIARLNGTEPLVEYLEYSRID